MSRVKLNRWQEEHMHHSSICRHQVWIDAGDIKLIGHREFGDDMNADIMKYFDEEAKQLHELGESQSV